MRLSWFMTVRSFLLSVILHIVLIGLLVISIDLTPVPKPPPKVNIVKAVSVDKQQVQRELEKIKAAEEQKRKAEVERQKDLERKAEEAKKKREVEEKRLKDIEIKKTEEKKQREQEQIRLKELEAKRKIEEEKKKLAEEKRKLEEEKKRKAEEERKRLEEEKRKQEAELKKLEEQKKREEEERKRKQEEEKRRKAEETMRQQELLEEQLELEEAQNQQDMSIIAQYTQRIRGLVEREFNTAGLPKGLSCVLYIRVIPGGDVVDVRILESSGNELFDRRAQTAVQKASPLPVPDESRLFEKMREIRFTFEPEN